LTLEDGLIGCSEEKTVTLMQDSATACMANQLVSNLSVNGFCVPQIKACLNFTCGACWGQSLWQHTAHRRNEKRTFCIIPNISEQVFYQVFWNLLRICEACLYPEGRHFELFFVIQVENNHCNIK
jgi:hypothetical protein